MNLFLIELLVGCSDNRFGEFEIREPLSDAWRRHGVIDACGMVWLRCCHALASAGALDLAAENLTEINVESHRDCKEQNVN